MTKRLFGIGAAVAATALAATFVAAQSAGAPGPTANPQAAELQASPQGQAGPGRGLGPGRGRGVGDQGVGGQSRGPRAGQAGPMRGRGRGPGQAAGPAGRRGGGGGLAALDLNEDQRAKVAELVRSARDQAGPLHDEFEFTRKTLHRELFADERDSAKIASLLTRLTTLEKQLADLRVTEATALADVLTAKQRETMRLRDGAARPGRGGPRGR